MYCLKWTNIYSGETGYVKSVSRKAGHFINASEKSGAKKYRYAKQADNDIAILKEIGEAVNNRFEIALL